MKVNLKELQLVVNKAVDEERLTEALRVEVSRVLGPSVITEGSLGQLAEAVNERLDVLDGTGRVPSGDFKVSIVSRLASHKNYNVRKFAARTLPVNMLGKLVQDGHSAVRTAVAQRVTTDAVREMMKRFPHDDQLRQVYKHRKQASKGLVVEAGIKQPKVNDEPLDIYGDEPLGDAVKQDRPELSEQWYDDKATLIMHDYGRNIEYNWEELAVHRFVSSIKATTGVEVDPKKLIEVIKKKIKAHEDKVLERDALKETLMWLESQSGVETLTEGFIETTDAVKELLESHLSPQTYVEKANSVFSIKHSTVPASIKKHRLGEGHKEESIPCIGKLPHNMSFRSTDEKALDVFCECWNSSQAFAGEPMKIEWSIHPEAVGKVSFNVTLK